MGLAEDIRASIYEEHLDEASFLYEQRGALPRGSRGRHSTTSPSSRRGSRRTSTGSCSAAPQALDALPREAAVGDDPGVQHAALRVFCRATARDALLEALAAIQQGEAVSRRAQAAPTRCARSCPTSSTVFAARCAARSGARGCSIVGARDRLPSDAALRSAARGGGAGRGGACECAWALGELRDKRAEPALLGLLWRGEPDWSAGRGDRAAQVRIECRRRRDRGARERRARRGWRSRSR